MIRTCKHCGETKPLTIEFFVPNKNCRDGLTGQCRACRLIEAREWKRQNSERLAGQRREDYARRWGPINAVNERKRAERAPFKWRAQRLRASMREAAKQGVIVASGLTVDFFENWLRARPTCSCCGVAFRVGPSGRYGKGPDDRAPTIDRFLHDHGYTFGNISLICWRCNNIKRNYEPSDLRRVADWFERILPRALQEAHLDAFWQEAAQ